jgi:hypothetical protein
MGDKSLMRRLIFILLVLISSLNSSDETVEDIKMMVQKIRNKRVGIDMSQLQYTENPFVSVVKATDTNVTKMVFKPKRIEIQLNLDATMNQQAKINGEWKKIGDMVSDYNITYIDDRKVILSRDNNHTKEIFIYKDKKIITSKGE